MRNLILAGVSALSLLSSASIASADVVTWTTWDSTSGGTAGPIHVTYAGPAVSVQTNYPSYMPASTFADGTIVSNAPTAANKILQIRVAIPRRSCHLFPSGSESSFCYLEFGGGWHSGVVRVRPNPDLRSRRPQQ